MKRRGESGQALVLTALALVTLLAVAGLAVDMGVMRYDKRVQQTAADAAAIAAATDISSGTWQSAGQNASSNNGFTDSGSGNSLSPCYSSGASVGMVCVEIDNPPHDGPHSTDSSCPLTTPSCDYDYVEARVAKVQPTFFMKILGIDSETVVARAVATDWSGAWGNGNDCVITTGPPSASMSANNAPLGVNGSVILNAPTCGIQDDGNLIANGGTNLSIDAASINVAYGYNGPSKTDCSSDPVVGVCPPPSANTGVIVPDPLLYKYPVPALGSCAAAGTCPTMADNSSEPVTFQPGTYVGGIINAGSEVIFNPGVYVIDGGTLLVDGGTEVCGGGTVADWTSTAWASLTTPACAYAGGVTFYITGGATVTVKGLATVQMYAPNSGTYEGLLFYQDSSDSNAMTLLGTSSSFYQGAIYEPNPSAQLYFGGNAAFNSGAAYTLIDVGQLTMAGNPDITLNSNYSSLSGGGGPLAGMINSAILVE